MRWQRNEATPGREMIGHINSMCGHRRGCVCDPAHTVPRLASFGEQPAIGGVPNGVGQSPTELSVINVVPGPGFSPTGRGSSIR